MPAQLLFRAEQPVGSRVLEILPPLFYRVELRRVWRQKLHKDIMLSAVVEYLLRLVPFGVVHHKEQSLVLGAETLEEFEKLSGVEFVTKHIVTLAMSLRAVAVEVRSDVSELLHRFCSARIPTMRDFWLDAESGFVQSEQRVALCYAFGNHAGELFLKRFCAALFAL